LLIADDYCGCISNREIFGDWRAIPAKAVRPAARLRVGLQAVVELVNPRGAPLRAWVTSIVPGTTRRAELSRDGLQMLALSDGVEVEIRAVHSGFLTAPR